jgi:hypothetical protein
MGRRDRWSDRQLYEARSKRKRLNPVWRGVGCLLIVVLGVVAYFFSGWFLRQGILYIPEAARRPVFAPFLPEFAFVQIVIALLFTILCYAILSTIYAVAFPIQPGELDAPPPRRRSARRR